jgi:3-deoxy-alpha-D-manno-octulosonate 8-oxidase
MYRNIKGVERTVFGRGSFEQLDEILVGRRNDNDKFVLFVIDHYFKGRDLEKRVPAKPEDIVLFIDVTSHEPTTEQIDKIRDTTKATKGIPGVVVGIGGGSILDIAKAVSLMFTNEGSSALYQGLNLVKNPGVYHIGIPTISGTGAEVSMTAVLTGPQKKLGLKSDWTVFNQIVLDPDLVASVPELWWFYTGMDAYIHCVESGNGILKNVYSHSYAEQALKLCREIYLGPGSGQGPENDEKLMLASLMGGLSLTYSEVGVCHALSYGLSKILGIRHGLANCIAFNHLEDFYPYEVTEFKLMVGKYKIDLHQGLSKHWSDEQITAMANTSYDLHHMWNHAIGSDWRERITIESIKDLYRRM